jgi:hypothetical protein
LYSDFGKMQLQQQVTLIRSYFASEQYDKDFPAGPKSTDPLDALCSKINLWVSAEFTKRMRRAIDVNPVTLEALSIFIVAQ